MRQFAKAGAMPNTFIGGIAKTGGTGLNAPIDTPYKLSKKLGIDVNRITGFRVVGDDVECRIRGGYDIPLAAFGSVDSGSNTNITTYFDVEGNVSLLLSGSFYGTPMQQVNFPSVTQIGNRSFDNCSFFNEGIFPMVTKIVGARTFAANTRLNNLYLPNLEEVEVSGATEARTFQGIGTNASSTLSILDVRKLKRVGTNPSLNRLTFLTIKTGITIRVHEDMATNNPIDLDYAKNTRGCTVEFYDDNGDYVSTL